jgi:glycosyltransferase involved in cell wall biosynthesis
VLATLDSLTLVLKQWQTTGPTLRDRAYARYQMQKMRRFEATQYLKGTRVCVVTAQEQRFLQSLAPTLSVSVISNGVDTDYFAPIRDAEKPAHIGFLGVMDYIPNRRAALYFAHEVMPRIWLQVPEAVFTIIGRNPTRDILALTKDPRICVTGTVEDVRPHVAEQQVMVVPMRETGGIKNKLLEAMAMGKALVTTPQGREGTDARHDQELFVASDADALADACVKLIREDSRRAELGVLARSWALAHSWKETAAQYLALYREAIHAAAGR